MSILRHAIETFSFEDESGTRTGYRHVLTHASGRCFTFIERNIFDFGPVINPEYAVREGGSPGGLAMNHEGKLAWQDFTCPTSRVGECEGSHEEGLARAPSSPNRGYGIEEFQRSKNIFAGMFIGEEEDPADLVTAYRLVRTSEPLPCDTDWSRISGWSYDRDYLAKLTHVIPARHGGWGWVRHMDDDERECYLAVANRPMDLQGVRM